MAQQGYCSDWQEASVTVVKDLWEATAQRDCSIELVVVVGVVVVVVEWW
jgi:hypothetical protein